MGSGKCWESVVLQHGFCSWSSMHEKTGSTGCNKIVDLQGLYVHIEKALQGPDLGWKAI